MFNPLKRLCAAVFISAIAFIEALGPTAPKTPIAWKLARKGLK